jgi:hypothetical protein
LHFVFLQTDGGAVLRLHDATVIDADKGYEIGFEVASDIKLEKGSHPIRLVYARGDEGEPMLQLHWSGPGFSKTEIARRFPGHY